MVTPDSPLEKESAQSASLANRHGRAVSAFLLNQQAVLPALASYLGGRESVFESAIRGNSMMPAIPGGARLRVRLLAEQFCRSGDIVFFLSDEGFMVHRVVYPPHAFSSAGYLLTLGDNCIVPDPPVSLSRVVGTIIAVHAGSGWLSPGPLVCRSVCHHLARAAATGIAIAALQLSAPASRRVAIFLRYIESAARAPIGRLLRRLHLISSAR